MRLDYRPTNKELRRSPFFLKILQLTIKGTFETHTIKRHVSIKRHQLQPSTIPHQPQNLRRVQNQPNVVERRRHEAPRADPPLPVLILERLLQQQRREKDADAGD